MKKILIVDDNDKNRKLVSVVLRSAGYETIEAENGHQGFELAKEFIPALIMMDIQMPVLSGGEVLKMLKSEQTTSGIPVIVLTSYAMTGDKDRFLEEGFDGYLAKPVGIKEILEVVEQFAHD